MFGSLLDLGPHLRIVFAALYVGGQVALVATAGHRPDAAFGFRMFAESSTLYVHLGRVLPSLSGHGSVVVPVEDGAWTAHDAGGTLRRIHWRDRVHEPALAVFDTPIHASYGAAAQLARLQAALDDVAAHTPDDTETEQLVMDVTVRKNGRELPPVHLTSRPRATSSPP